MLHLLKGVAEGCRGKDLLDRVPDFVDLFQRGQEVDGSRRLPIVELLAVEVHFESAAVGGVRVIAVSR
jgi:hypothetical protein